MKYQVTYRTNHSDAAEEFTSLKRAMGCAEVCNGHVQQIMDFDEPTKDPIVQIYEFNKAAGLLDKPYDYFLESSFQIEEALEGFSSEAIRQVQETIEISIYPKEMPTYAYSPKGLARTITSCMYHTSEGGPRDIVGSDVERLDKACDAVVFAVGSMAKLKLTPDQIREALNIVMAANMQKLTMPKDEQGKLMKPDNFEGPEAKLQTILDEREPEKC